MTWEDDITDAIAMGQGGGVVLVNSPPGASGLATVAVLRYTLPRGVSTPWVITASPLAVRSGALPLGTATAAALRVSIGVGNVNVANVLLDLPAAGCCYQVPPCNSIDLAADLVPLPAVDAAWYVGAAPGNTTTAAPPVLTAPTKSINALTAGTFQRPALARAYRPYLPAVDLAGGTGTLPVVQQNASGALVTDASSATTFFGAANGSGLDRGGWLPLHPLTTEVGVTNTDAVLARVIGVQWLLAFG